MQKKEKGPLSFKSRDGITVPSKRSSLRSEYDRRYRQAYAERFHDGNPDNLRLVKVPIEKVKPQNLAVNNDRLDLYHKMYQAGDEPPAGFGVPSGNEFRLKDGSHRYEAAKAAGQKYIKAWTPKSENPADKQVRKAEALERLEAISEKIKILMEALRDE